MQNRIDQMLAAWNNLNLLRSVRQDRYPDYSSAGIENLPSPAFDKLPAIPLIRSVSRIGALRTADSYCGMNVLADNEVLPFGADPAVTILPPQSSPPQLTSDRLAKISSSSVELPELPHHLAHDADDLSPTPSPRAIEPGSAGRSFNVKKLRKKASKRLSKLKIDLSEIAQKMSPRSGRSSPEKSSPVRKTSPRKDDPRLAGIPVAERNRIAIEMAKFCLNDDYKNAGATRQSLLFNGKLIGHLQGYPDLIDSEALKALRADLDWRMQYANVDTVVNLEDLQFLDFVKAAADGNFMKPWVHDSADTTNSATGERKKNSAILCPTFVRDFDNSNYFVRSTDGELTRLSDTDAFIEFVGSGQATGLAHTVSNIASQNLGNFLKNVLFLRLDANKESQSVLRLCDGTPVMPLAVAKASYVFETDVAGNITLDYIWKSSDEINGGKALKVKRMAGDNSQATVSDALLEITVRISIAPDGEWSIANPRIRAQGWSLPVDQ